MNTWLPQFPSRHLWHVYWNNPVRWIIEGQLSALLPVALKSHWMSQRTREIKRLLRCFTEKCSAQCQKSLEDLKSFKRTTTEKKKKNHNQNHKTSKSQKSKTLTSLKWPAMSFDLHSEKKIDKSVITKRTRSIWTKLAGDFIKEAVMVTTQRQPWAADCTHY